MNGRVNTGRRWDYARLWEFTMISGGGGVQKGLEVGLCEGVGVYND